MGLFQKFKFFKLLVFSSFICLVISCSKKIINEAPAPSPQGGQDSGGGGTFGSSYGEVEAQFKDIVVLKKSLTEISDKLEFKIGEEDRNLGKKIGERIYQIKIDILQKEKEEGEERARNAVKEEGVLGQGLENLPAKCRYSGVTDERVCNFRVIIENKESYRKSASAEAKYQIRYEDMFPNDFTTERRERKARAILAEPVALEKIWTAITIRLDYTESCKDIHEQNKAASVSSFSLNSDICISIKELAKIPKESLKKQIHALLIHEFMHLLGFHERDALVAQTLVLSHYDELIKNKNYLNYATKISLSLKPKQLEETISLVLGNYKKENFGKKSLYTEEIFLKYIDILNMTSEEGLEVLDVYMEHIQEFVTITDDRDEFFLENLWRLKEIFLEIKSLGEIVVQFGQTNDRDFYKYCSKEEYFFIYDRLSFLERELKTIGQSIETIAYFRGR